jgi:hypothetical protein
VGRRESGVSSSSISEALSLVLKSLNMEDTTTSTTSLSSLISNSNTTEDDTSSSSTPFVAHATPTLAPTAPVDPSLLAELIRRHQIVQQSSSSSSSSSPWIGSTSILGNGSMLQEQQDAQELLQVCVCVIVWIRFVLNFKFKKKKKRSYLLYVF